MARVSRSVLLLWRYLFGATVCNLKSIGLPIRYLAYIHSHTPAALTKERFELGLPAILGILGWLARRECSRVRAGRPWL